MAIKSNLDSDALPPQTQDFALPSGGITYRRVQKDFPSIVTIEPYSFEVEEILRSSADTSHAKLRKIVAQVVKNFPSGFDWSTLLSGDHAVIMAIARAMTYGEQYTFSTECPQCEHVERHSIKIPDELPVKTWKYATYEDFEKGSTVELPHCKDKVKVFWPTLSDPAMEESQKPKGGATVLKPIDKFKGKDLVLEYASRIDTVNNGKPDSLAEAATYVSRLKGKDKVAFEDFLLNNDCGIDPSWTIICDKCGHQYQRLVPVSLDFFRRNRV